MTPVVIFLMCVAAALTAEGIARWCVKPTYIKGVRRK